MRTNSGPRFCPQIKAPRVVFSVRRMRFSEFSEWSDPAVAIPAGFHIDSFLQFGKPYQILLGPEARLDDGRTLRL
jgi:hypothetical protein